MRQILVSCFSASGTTKNVAQKLARTLEADLFEIEPEIPYTTSDLNWNDKQSRSTIEMEDLNVRPGIARKVSNLENYDRIVLGFPVWWYTAPRIINTFLEENDLTNKRIYIFVTSGGSSSEGSMENLKKSYPNLNFIDSRRFTGNEDKNEYIKWVSE